MSRCSKKCNEIKEKIDSISGLDDDYVYDWLKNLESVTSSIVGFINTYADRNELNGTCFKDEIEIDNIEELLKIEEYEVDKTDTVINRNKINELVQAVKQLNKRVKELEELNIEINEKDINEAIIKAREQRNKEIKSIKEK